MNGQVVGSQGNNAEVIVGSPPYIDHKDENLMEAPLYQAPSVTDISTVDEVVQTVPAMVEVAPQPKLESAAPMVSLLNHEESEGFRMRWNEIQAKFVDEPRSAVQQADGLVTDVVDKITKMFFTEHGNLELQWKQGSEVSTEDLRKALQHYRSFFNRLMG